ncbi:threonine-phosphate decarboxylase [Saccharopolyspora sp. HNM0983]|uniref:Aminotransferase n=1 Tax=Saccharopolyspora montiporae TaxID=2781240 RepID=A0A929BAW3_9PSEU|nr:Rv2231c family pyridoxal phosphate-dependent protein CobC [Saccharopolyspora sp. HNM0983]MBE9374651.1 threonine-phosphate decarboxylase [Saccharopolyspora sp. HNM0983]
MSSVDDRIRGGAGDPADERDLLRHHGDVDAAGDLLDFAVNVRLGEPPEWLRARLGAVLGRLGSYPSAAGDAAAREAVAAAHGRDPADVLALSGAAEGFALLPWLRPRLAAVVHPSFTEPELALRNAGVEVARVGLDPADGYRLRAADVPERADLVVLGNPTNPTSVLHPAEEVRRLLRPGRVVVVDEAFMDAVPGEPESLAGVREPGLLVLRSLTKMWALPGLRAGYALGEPELLARLAHNRPHWPVSALVLEALVACSEPGARAEAAAAARTFAADRAELVAGLDAVPGLSVARPAHAPFLLVHAAGGARVRESLRERGIAVRRGDTFPGLDEGHFRVAVRSSAQNARLVRELDAVL